MYINGATVKISCTFKVATVLTDPATVTLKVRDPSANTDTYTYAGGSVTKNSTGDYSKNVAVDEVGTWRYQWIGTGSAAGLDEGEFVVGRAAI